MGTSIRIDSRCRIVMKNFDSVSQLLDALATCITVLQDDRVMAHIRVTVAMRVGRSSFRWTGRLVQQLQDQSPEPLVCSGGRSYFQVGGQVEVDRGRGSWGGSRCPSPPARGSGERCKLPQRDSGVLGGAPTANAFWAHRGARERGWWLQIFSFC